MAETAKVLVVDDSAVVRTIVRRAVARSHDFVVVDTAPNGRAALEKVRALSPDVVTLDIEMPVMDGLTTLRALKAEFPRIPVIMVSALTAQGAEATVDALLAGADSYIQKPSATAGVEDSVLRVAEELLPKLRSVVKAPGGVPAPSPVGRVAVSAAPRARELLSVPPALLAIGSSTGGPVALLEVLRNLPESFPIPIVITQHMPPTFTAMLAKRLSAETPFVVREGERGGELRPGLVWLAPGDYHMTVERVALGGGCISLNQDPQEHSCRPAVDVMFRSVAAAYKGAALAVVLTGMGYDGGESSKLIRQMGGCVLAQDEASSVVWGMPGAVVKAGAASEVVPLSEMARTITEYCRFSMSQGNRVTRGAHVY